MLLEAHIKLKKSYRKINTKLISPSHCMLRSRAHSFTALHSYTDATPHTNLPGYTMQIVYMGLNTGLGSGNTDLMVSWSKDLMRLCRNRFVIG